jgi:tetrapyrrole methylase family protein / MazG family protein
MTKSTESIHDLVKTVKKLRAPDGCPWDKVQTHQSIRQYLIEEAYEVLDVLDRIPMNSDLKKENVKNSLLEELGDLLMQIMLHSEMASEQGAFNFYDVADALNNKLIRRHTHVFGEVKAGDAEAAFQNWEKEKAKEKAKKTEASVLDGVPQGLPALQKASRVIEKVTKVGFQWKDLVGPMEKLDEEFAEFKEELKKMEKNPSEEQRKRMESELGDLFFSLCNLAQFVKISPEDALRSTLQRFHSRFQFVEKKLKELGKTPEQSNLEEMDRFWNEAKAAERK